MRASENDLKQVIEQGKDADGVLIPFAAHIRKASLLIDRVETCAIDRKKTLTDEELLELEILVAAHFYALRVPQKQSKGTQSSSASYKLGDYLQSAYALDPSGCLRSVIEAKRAGAVWLGKKRSEQTAYVDRD